MKTRSLLLFVLCALLLCAPALGELVEPVIPSGDGYTEALSPEGNSELVEPVFRAPDSGLVEALTPAPTVPPSGAELVERITRAPGGGSGMEYLTPAPTAPSGGSSELVEFITPAPGGGSGLVEYITPAPAGMHQAVSFTGYITSGGVNVRSGPGLNYQSYTQVSRGTVIHVTASARDYSGRLWYYGTLGSVTGWVMGSYVQGGSAPGPYVPPYTPGGEGSAPFSWGYVRLNGTNVRTGPGMGYGSIFQAAQGTGVQVLSSAHDTNGTLWYRVSVSGVTGYIRADLVSSSGGGAHPDPTSDAPVSFTGYVISNTANVRSSPSTFASVITVLVRGQSIPVTGFVHSGGSSWYKVAYLPGQYGYVSSSLLSSGPWSPTAAPYDPGTSVSFYGYTNTPAVNVRAYPNGGKIAQLARGTSVYVSHALWSGGELWYYVSYSGGSGYIRSDLISRGSGPSVTPQPSWNETSTYFSGMTIKDKCNIRTGPGYAWDAVDQINYGERVTAYALSYDAGGNCWYRISYLSGRSGYILSDLVGAYDAAAIRRHRAAQATAVPTPYVVYATAVPTPYVIYATPVPTPYVIYATPVPTQIPAYGYAQPTAVPAWAPTAAPADALNFTGFTPSAVQTLPVYSAPGADAWISDGGTASVTTSGNIWVGGYEGQWLLVLYQNAQRETRVGYVNGFSFQGSLPDAPALSFSRTSAVLSSQAVLTDDPLGQTSSILSLNAGARVTFLTRCNLGSLWAYVETSIGGSPVRGFIPLSSLEEII